MPDWFPVNWDLIKNPLNWITVILMVVFFGIVVDVFIAQWAPSKQGDE